MQEFWDGFFISISPNIGIIIFIVVIVLLVAVAKRR